MKVTLIDYTQNAINKLLYTKATRLTLGQDTRLKIANMSDEEKAKELAYMATTVPSSWEFVTYTFEILGVTRAFTHQFVRTRTGSYAQQTMRTLHVGQFEYVTGPSINTPRRKKLYDECMAMINCHYEKLIADGAAVEDARGLLPTNICTNIIAQFNLRTLAEMVRSRSGTRTQDEYRRVVNCMVDEVLAVHPWAKDFLYPRRQECLAYLESIINTSNETKENKILALKIIDKLRKEQ